MDNENGDPDEEKTAPDAAQTLRVSLLEYLVNLWEGQRETIRLAEQWSRYEASIEKASAEFLAHLTDKTDDLQTRVNKASKGLSRARGLSKDQKSQAASRALQAFAAERKPKAHGRTGAALRTVTNRRRDLGLLSSQLVTLVADFEVFVLKVTTAWLDFDASHLSGHKRELTFAELGELGSVDEIRTSMVHKFLEQHMRQSAGSWFSVFCDLFSAPKIVGASDFTTLEVFQRRHIVVHHGGEVSRQYLQALKDFDHGAELGDHLAIDFKYVVDAADALGIVAHSIALAALYASAKDAKARDVVEREAGEMTFLLLNQGRDLVVQRYLKETDLGRIKREFSREQMRVNGWIAQRRLGNVKAMKAQVASWDVSAKDNSFKIAKHALLEETEEAVAIARRMIDASDLSLFAIQTWPLFEGVRDELLEALEDDGSDGDGGPHGDTRDGEDDSDSGDDGHTE